MIKKEINFREAEESAYGLAYLQPYLENSPSKPLYLVLEQIFREHEIYKGIVDNMTTMHEATTKQLDKIQKKFITRCYEQVMQKKMRALFYNVGIPISI